MAFLTGVLLLVEGSGHLVSDTITFPKDNDRGIASLHCFLSKNFLATILFATFLNDKSQGYQVGNIIQHCLLGEKSVKYINWSSSICKRYWSTLHDAGFRKWLFGE